jgi:hypothetical protein
VYWLADANLAATVKYNLPIGPNGTMDYKTACKWVEKLNADPTYSLLGRGHWQLPITPHDDPTCSSKGPKPYTNSFGIGCGGNAMGDLYYNSFDLNGYPSSIVPFGLNNKVSHFHNLQPLLYWTANGTANGNADTFSFNVDFGFQNTVQDNYLHVLPMVPHWIGSGMPPKPGSGLVLYPGGQAVYDSDTGCTWAADANLAASNYFDVYGWTTISGSIMSKSYTVPLVATSGTMLWSTADPKNANGWMAAMNAKSYAGSSDWQLPAYATTPSNCIALWPCACGDLQTLFNHMNLTAGDSRLRATGSVYGFQNLQPFFYWSCPQDPSDTSTQAQCSGTEAGKSSKGIPMWFSFNWDTGFTGTDEWTKPFNVMVYWPASPSSTPPPDCSALP